MSESPTVSLVRRLYDSGMAPEVTAEIIAPDLVWDISPGFPNGGVYHGWESVGQDFFGKLMPSFDAFGAQAEQFFGDDQGHVFVLGRYEGVTHRGEAVEARFTHVWTVRNNKLAHLRQTADSYPLRAALAS